MLKKQYVKSRKVSKVTFEIPKDELPEGVDARTLHLVGDFNDWDQEATPMKKLKDGTFKITIELTPGCEYHFRYLLDGEFWINEWHADDYASNPFGADNCVVITPSE